MCTTLNGATPASKVWNVTNTMAGKKPSRTDLQSLIVSMDVSAQELGEVLADSFFLNDIWGTYTATPPDN